MSGESVETGFFGKIPSRGDFLQKGLPAGFVQAWDGWLEAAMARGRLALGVGWNDAFMTAPIWRFHLAAGLCGPEAACGIMLPSVDRVGRAFPLVLCRVGTVPLAPALASAAVWFDAIEDLAFAVLEQALEPDAIVERMAGLDPLYPAAAVPLAGGLRIPLTTPTAFSLDLLARTGVAGVNGLGIWWSTGSDLVEPSLLWYRGMPSPDAFPALVVGDWDGFGWGHAPLGEGA